MESESRKLRPESWEQREQRAGSRERAECGKQRGEERRGEREERKEQTAEAESREGRGQRGDATKCCRSRIHFEQALHLFLLLSCPCSPLLRSPSCPLSKYSLALGYQSQLNFFVPGRISIGQASPRGFFGSGNYRSYPPTPGTAVDLQRSQRTITRDVAVVPCGDGAAAGPGQTTAGLSHTTFTYTLSKCH